jgi:hypothetical protein
VGRSRRFYRLVQLVLGLVQELLGLGSMSGHIVMVRGASAVHFMDRLDYVIVDLVEIVPIPHSLRKRYSGHEGECRCYGEHYFLHAFSQGRMLEARSMRKTAVHGNVLAMTAAA